jgi:hypothetical protein
MLPLLCLLGSTCLPRVPERPRARALVDCIVCRGAPQVQPVATGIPDNRSPVAGGIVSEASELVVWLLTSVSGAARN